MGEVGRYATLSDRYFLIMRLRKDLGMWKLGRRR